MGGPQCMLIWLHLRQISSLAFMVNSNYSYNLFELLTCRPIKHPHNTHDEIIEINMWNEKWVILNHIKELVPMSIEIFSVLNKRENKTSKRWDKMTCIGTSQYGEKTRSVTCVDISLNGHIT